MTPGRAEPLTVPAGTAAVTALAALLLGGCGGVDPDALVPSPPPAKPTAAPAVSPTASMAAQDPAKPSPAFTPLPTPQQVVAALPAGRPDPFAPIPPPPGKAAGSTPLRVPEGLRFNGVVLASGRPKALVQFQGNTGSVSVGDQGGRSTDLLPTAWSVAAVDVAQGRLILVTGSAKNSPQITLEL